MKRRSLALLLLAGWFLASSAPGWPEDQAEALLPSPSRERSIAGGEAHVYRVEVADSPLLLTVKQLGLDLVLKDQGPGAVASVDVDSGDHAFGSEVLLLESTGGHRIEVRSKDRFVAP